MNNSQLKKQLQRDREECLAHIKTAKANVAAQTARRQAAPTVLTVRGEDLAFVARLIAKI